MLRPFAHPVACCCVLLGVVAPFAYHCNKDATRTQQHATWLAQQCWELLFHLRLGNSTWEFLGVIFSSRDFGGGAVGIVGSLKDVVGF